MGKGGYIGGSTVIHAGSGWFGKGSITSQPGGKKKRQSVQSKPKRKKKTSKSDTSVPKKGNGLTLAEIKAKAQKKVRAIESEIAKTKRRLAQLERDHAKALVEAEKTNKMPPKTAIGMALQKAHQTSAKSKSNLGTEVSNVSENEADFRRKVTFRETSKGVVIEHRSARKVPTSKVAKNS